MNCYLLKWLVIYHVYRYIIHIAGVCHCEDGYAGADCSIDITIAPTLTVMVEDVLCDVRWGNEMCNTVTIEGSGFFKSMQLSCHITESEVIYINSIRIQNKFPNYYTPLRVFKM